jgi:hypothetical protein
MPDSTALSAKFNPYFAPMTTLKISTSFRLSISVKIALFVMTAISFRRVTYA